MSTNCHHTLLEEIVYHGNISLALEKNYVSPQDILEWLLCTSSYIDVTNLSIPTNIYTRTISSDISDKKVIDLPTIDMYIAYFNLCKNITPNEHYSSDGKHILCVHPILGEISLLYKLDPLITSNKNSYEPLDYVLNLHANNLLQLNKQNIPIISNITDSLIKYISCIYKSVNNSLMNLYSNDTYVINMLKSGIELGLNDDKERCNNVLVRCDKVDKFRRIPSLGKEILSRVKLLIDVAPNYYDLIRSDYVDIMKELYQKKLLNYDYETIKDIINYFPDVIDEEVLGYNILKFKIHFLDNKVSGYLLGFDISKIVVTNDDINKALSLLEQNGFKWYQEKIRNYNKQQRQLTNIMGDTLTNLGNQVDTIGEDIDNYLPFDLIYHWSNNRIYVFTRMEFKYIMEKKKNPWTNVELPKSVYLLATAKYQAAENLPECDTINSLHDKLLGDKLTYDTKVKSPRADLSSYDSNSILYSLLFSLAQ